MSWYKAKIDFDIFHNFIFSLCLSSSFLSVSSKIGFVMNSHFDLVCFSVTKIYEKYKTCHKLKMRIVVV
jgi:hypothetical protein